MKKLLCFALTVLFAASAVMAQTPAEKQASADRIQKLKAEAPKDCGVDKIDDVVTKCKSVADATVAVDAVTAAVSGCVTAEQLAGLQGQLQKATRDLTEAGKLLGDATASLKEIKNPMKVKSATKSVNYAKDVITLAGEELPYQGKVVAALVCRQ